MSKDKKKNKDKKPKGDVYQLNTKGKRLADNVDQIINRFHGLVDVNKFEEFWESIRSHEALTPLGEDALDLYYIRHFYENDGGITPQAMEEEGYSLTRFARFMSEYLRLKKS